MVSLPAKWVRQQGLKKGEELDLEESGSFLTIGTRKRIEMRKTRINLADYGKLGSRAIGALYKQGLDEIEIIFTTPDDIDMVNKNLNEFIGFEIVHQTTKGCTIREISQAKEEEFEAILNRTILLLKSIAEDCYNSLAADDTKMLPALAARDTTINKYANYCRRILNKYGYKEAKKTPMLYYIVEELENLGDEYKSLSLFVTENNVKLNKAQLELLSYVNKMLDILYHLILKFDIGRATELHTLHKGFSTKIHKLENTKEAKETRLIDSLSGMTRIMMNILGPLMTMGIE